MNSLRILSLIALVTFSAQADAGKTEPTYKGKPLAYWLDRLQTAPSDPAQLEAANAIAAFGADAEPAVPRLVELLDDHSPEYRGMIAITLGTIAKDAKSVVPAMIELLEEKRARDPESVFYVLQSAGPKAKDAVPQLQNALKHENAKIRLAASQTLWEVAKHPDVVPALVLLIKNEGADRENGVRFEAVNLLTVIGPEAKSALPALRAALARAKNSEREHIEEAIRVIENK